MVFYWSLNDSKSPQVFWTLLRFLVDIYNAIVWIVSTCVPISKSSNLCTNPLGTLPYFISSPARSRYLSAGTVKSHIRQILFFSFFFFFFFFFLTITWSGRLDGFWVIHIPFVRMVKFELLTRFLVDYLPHLVAFSLILFSFCLLAVFAYYVIDRFVSITT